MRRSATFARFPGENSPGGTLTLIDHHYEVAAEQEVLGHLKDLATMMALEVDVCPQVWDRGDGHGGTIISLIAEAMADMGYSLAADGDFDIPSHVERLAGRDGWECHYCGCPLGWGDPDMLAKPTISHVVPTGRGGTSTLFNLVLSCTPCDRTKGDRTPLEWLGEQEVCCALHRAGDL